MGNSSDKEVAPIGRDVGLYQRYDGTYVWKTVKGGPGIEVDVKMSNGFDRKEGSTISFVDSYGLIHELGTVKKVSEADELRLMKEFHVFIERLRQQGIINVNNRISLHDKHKKVMMFEGDHTYFLVYDKDIMKYEITSGSYNGFTRTVYTHNFEVVLRLDKVELRK